MSRFHYTFRESPYCPVCPAGRPRPATHMVRDSSNTVYGYYCREHAEAKAKRLQELYEAAATEREV